jgi:glyoxylase-like metal-dependent hydrolase (beta-lactamase superfamily II)
LAVGIDAFPGLHPSDLVLWAGSRSVLLAGDSLIDRGSGLEVPTDWTDDGASLEDLLDEMRQLLELPVEHVLPTHGEPTDRDALERALA